MLSHLAVLDSPLVQSLRLSRNLVDEIKGDPKTTNYFSAVSEEAVQASQLATAYLNSQKTSHPTLCYDSFDYPSL